MISVTLKKLNITDIIDLPFNVVHELFRQAIETNVARMEEEEKMKKEQEKRERDNEKAQRQARLTQMNQARAQSSNNPVHSPINNRPAAARTYTPPVHRNTSSRPPVPMITQDDLEDMMEEGL